MMMEELEKEVQQEEKSIAVSVKAAKSGEIKNTNTRNIHLVNIVKTFLRHIQ